jgi:hypothetical protein
MVDGDAGTISHSLELFRSRHQHTCLTVEVCGDAPFSFLTETEE